MGYIYKITNTINGMMYIGQTIDLEERWRLHIGKRSNCRYLKRAFGKYGVENFKFDLICICFDESMNNYEIEYMKLYNTLVPNGYNLRLGGNNGRHHEETKVKIGESLKGKIYPERRGIKLSEEHKRKLSIAHKGIIPKSLEKMIARAKRLAKPMIQLTLEGEFVRRFDSGVIAAAELHGHNSGLHRACKGEAKQYLGFKWMYEVNYLNQ